MAEPAERVLIEATDAEINAVIEEFGGDPRLAIRAILHDLTQLAIDAGASVSRGYVRGRLLPFQTPAKRQEAP
jgi:hypothetical protein